MARFSSLPLCVAEQIRVRRNNVSIYANLQSFAAIGPIFANIIFATGVFLRMRDRQHQCATAGGNLAALKWYQVPGRNDDIKRASAYSPVLDRIDLATSMHTFNGALRDNSSIWRKPPSPEVDAAWDYISAEGFELITVSKDDVTKSQKDPEITLQAPESWGEGAGQYFVQMEVFHQIHCLNELRKEMNYDYYYSSPPNELHKAHKAHCLHMLLQALMCSADVGIITHNWVHNENIPDPKTRPMPDFNVVKKCANFDSLLEWNREVAIKDFPSKWPSLKYIPGMKIVPGQGYA